MVDNKLITLGSALLTAAGFVAWSLFRKKNVSTQALQIIEVSQDQKAVLRRGGRKDLKQVLGLVQKLAEFEKEPDAVEVTVEQLEKDGSGAHPLFRTLVVDVNGELVAFALYFDTYSTWKGRCLYLDDLYVDPSFRSCGLGLALLKEIAREGKSLGCRRVQWQALDWNVNAINFYKKLGAVQLDEWLNFRLCDSALDSFAS